MEKSRSMGKGQKTDRTFSVIRGRDYKRLHKSLVLASGLDRKYTLIFTESAIDQQHSSSLMTFSGKKLLLDGFNLRQTAFGCNFIRVGMRVVM